MYAVVGCGECRALWIIEGRAETSQCPRCGTTRGYEKRRKFVTTEDENHARDVRASMLAARAGHSDAFAELESFAELEDLLEDAGIDDETYLRESGLDADAVQHVDADGSSTSQSREAVIREALRNQQRPTSEDVVEYAHARGVPPEYTERALQKLVASGEVSENQGSYRLL